MDEYNSGMDPEMKKYFSKILNSFSAGLAWLIFNATAGLYFRLGFIRDGVRWYNIAFYLAMAASLVMLVRYYHGAWGNKKK